MSGEAAPATLSEYLERALDRGGHLIMVRSESGASVLYLDEVSLSDEELTKCGVIQNELADAILEATGPTSMTRTSMVSVTVSFGRSPRSVALERSCSPPLTQ